MGGRLCSNVAIFISRHRQRLRETQPCLILVHLCSATNTFIVRGNSPLLFLLYLFIFFSLGKYVWDIRKVLELKHFQSSKPKQYQVCPHLTASETYPSSCPQGSVLCSTIQNSSFLQFPRCLANILQISSEI